jgi:hypothetical protein
MYRGPRHPGRRGGTRRGRRPRRALGRFRVYGSGGAWLIRWIVGNGTPAASRDMLGADQGATARRAARHVRRSTGRSRRNRDSSTLIALDQRVVNILAQRRGEWFCDSCLAVALGLPVRHAVQYVTDALAVGRSHSRSRGACRDCRRHTTVTTAN